MAVVALVQTWFEPGAIHGVGFQLSYLACLGILLLAPRARALLPVPRWLAGSLANWLANQLAGLLASWLANWTTVSPPGWLAGRLCGEPRWNLKVPKPSLEISFTKR